MSGLTALAAAPAVYLLYLIYKLDKKEKEPIGFLIKLMGLGALTTIPACILELIGEGLIGTVFDLEEPIAVILFYMVVVAGSEELVKMFALYVGTWGKPSFNCRFDGVVYAVAVSLGFALLENVLYVLQYGAETGIIRALTAVPLHCAAGIYMGEFYGNAKKYANEKNSGAKTVEMTKAYFVPVLLHGVYDCLCSFEYDGWIVVFFIFVVVMYVVTIKNVIRYSRNDVFIGVNSDAMAGAPAYACFQQPNAAFGIGASQVNMAYAIGRAKSELFKTNIYNDNCHGVIIDSMLNLSPTGGSAPKIQMIVGGARLFVVQNGVVTFDYRTNSNDDVVFYILDYTIGVIASVIAPNNPVLSAKIRNDAFARIGGVYDYWHKCGRYVMNMRPM